MANKWCGQAKKRGFLGKRVVTASTKVVKKIYCVVDNLDLLSIYGSKNDAKNKEIKPKEMLDLNELISVSSTKNKKKKNPGILI